MRGFDTGWRILPHFIIGIAKEIWEGRRSAPLMPRCAEVHVMGSSHADFGPFAGAGRQAKPTIRHGFTLIEETATWKQILLQTGYHE